MKLKIGDEVKLKVNKGDGGAPKEGTVTDTCNSADPMWASYGKPHQAHYDMISFSTSGWWRADLYTRKKQEHENKEEH